MTVDVSHESDAPEASTPEPEPKALGQNAIRALQGSLAGGDNRDTEVGADGPSPHAPATEALPAETPLVGVPLDPALATTELGNDRRAEGEPKPEVKLHHDVAIEGLFRPRRGFR